MGIRVGGGFIYMTGGASFAPTVPLDVFSLLRFIHVLGERGRFDVDAVLVQLFSYFFDLEAALLHALKRRIKGADSLSVGHFVVAFERLFLVLEIGKFRQNLADSLSIGRHNVFFPFDVFFTSG